MCDQEIDNSCYMGHSRNLAFLTLGGQQRCRRPKDDASLRTGCRPPQALTRNKVARTFKLPASVGSSRVDLQACKLEYSIVSPK